MPAASAKFAARSYYLKVRDRASYAFALVSAAVALDVDANNQIKDARVVLGSVAHKPWRAAEAERALTGKRATAETFKQAGEAAMQNAKAFEHNRYKIEMSRRVIVRALETALAGGKQIG